jgi:undecaprenyl-phosphate 4-deoxy-4-formamido-L-arabinose transferase
MSTVNLSLVAPVFNEEANLDELIERCIRVCESLETIYEIILVDDGSQDASRTILRSNSHRNPGRVVAVLLNRNYGQHRALLAGLAQSKGEVVVTLDADLQNQPEDIPKLLAKVSDGCDVVGSVRINRRDSWLRRLPSRIVNAMVRKVTGVQMSDYGCMLRAYRREIIDAILSCPERSTFIPVLANQFASKTDEVAVAHAERTGGESKYSFWKLINLQFDLLTGMTAFPLRLMSISGGLLAVLGILASVTLVVLRFVYGAAWAADGVFTVLAGLFLFTGVQLLGLGLLGEYISRIYEDVRGRPRYFIQEIIACSPDNPSGEEEVIQLPKRREKQL